MGWKKWWCGWEWDDLTYMCFRSSACTGAARFSVWQKVAKLGTKKDCWNDQGLGIKLSKRLYKKVGWEGTLWIWLPFFSLSGSYNSCFFCFFLLPRALGKGRMTESWAWKHLVHMNATAEDVFNQRRRLAFVCIAVSCSSETWCLFRGLKNRVTVGTGMEAGA